MMSKSNTATPAFLAHNLTPPDLEMVLGLTHQAKARDEAVRLVIRDGESCIRLNCEPAPLPARPVARVKLRAAG